MWRRKISCQASSDASAPVSTTPLFVVELVVAGEDDPITPISRSELIMASLPPGVGRLIRVPNAGHGIHNDDPALAMRVLREFGLPREALGWSLFSFNVGVEMGQTTRYLRQVASADGGRYANSNESYVFWVKGKRATINGREVCEAD